jgi:DNA-binding beta-propeller fold protein YncE
VVSVAVELPGGKPGIGFDDLQWSDELGRVIVPAGRTGKVFLIDPDTLKLTTISGFSASSVYDGGHDFGVTSAVHGAGFLYAIDRTTRQLVQIDLTSGKRTGALKLHDEPDYVRFVATTRELWVTEPHGATIEVVALGTESPPSLRAVQRLRVPRGPEALQLDLERGRAYTNSFLGTTYAIDLRAHKLASHFDNHCWLSLGLALDPKSQRIYVACAAGAVRAFSAGSGEARGSVEVGLGVDIIGFDAANQRVLVPSAWSGQLRSVQASGGKLHVRATANTARASSCVVADGKGRAWACDPKHGRMLRVTFPR